MSRPLRIPRPETPLHLYRHLLRESSYLPPIVRTVVDGRIKNRFRRHQHDKSDKSIKTAIRRGNHELRALRASVAGDMPRRDKLLCQAFGRAGWRRRELMDVLTKRHETPAEPGLEAGDLGGLETQAKDELANAERQEDWLDHWDLPKVLAFAKSQISFCHQNDRKGVVLQSSHLKIEANIPKTDIWGRPLARRLHRTKTLKAWKHIAERIMPPLPAREWDQLHDLVRGKGIDPKWANTHRRALARSPSGLEDDPHPWKWKAYATKPVAIVDHQLSRKNKLLSGALGDGTPWGDREAFEVHRWTPLRWKRILFRVFRQTAKMQRKLDGQGWDIVWGAGEFKPPTADAAAMEFLEGYTTPQNPPQPTPNLERRARRAAAKAEKAKAAEEEAKAKASREEAKAKASREEAKAMRKAQAAKEQARGRANAARRGKPW